MEPKWDIVDTVVGVIAGAISAIMAIMGWIGPKFVKVDEKNQTLRDDMDTRIESAHSRITENAREITRLRAHREDDQRRLEGIDRKLDRILDWIPRRENRNHEGRKGDHE